MVNKSTGQVYLVNFFIQKFLYRRAHAPRCTREYVFEKVHQVHGGSVPSPLRAPARATLALLSLLALVLAGCELADSTAWAPAYLACGWEPMATVSKSTPVGSCWASSDPDVIVTGVEATDPCDAPERRLEAFPAGRTVTVWKPSFPPRTYDVVFDQVQCEQKGEAK